MSFHPLKIEVHIWVSDQCQVDWDLAMLIKFFSSQGQYWVCKSSFPFGYVFYNLSSSFPMRWLFVNYSVHVFVFNTDFFLNLASWSVILLAHLVREIITFTLWRITNHATFMASDNVAKIPTLKGKNSKKPRVVLYIWKGWITCCQDLLKDCHNNLSPMQARFSAQVGTWDGSSVTFFL